MPRKAKIPLPSSANPAMLAALSLLLGCSGSGLAIDKVYEQDNRLILSYSARLSGEGFGFVRGRAKLHCQQRDIDSEPVLVNVTPTLNGIAYAEFWCLNRTLDGVPAQRLMPVPPPQRQEILANQGSLPPEPLPQPFR